jgi:hypothetical protein
MANRFAIRNPQTIRLVVDSDATGAGVSYTALGPFEIIESWVINTVAVANNTTIKNGATTLATVASGAAVGDVDYAIPLGAADITKLYFGPGDVLNVTASAGTARFEAFFTILPGVTAAT